MPKYEVTIREIEIYVVPVEAENEDQASEIAWEMITENEDSKYKYHNDSDGETEVEEIDFK